MANIDNLNKSDTIFKDSKASDTALNNKDLKEKTKLTGKNVDRVPFKCEVVYHSLYPNGFTTTVQGIVVNLIFDGRTVMLPKWIAEFVQTKIEKKAESEVEKNRRNENPDQAMEFKGRY